MTIVAGVDSSTQSCKIVVCDADTGTVLRQAQVAHPDGTAVAPEAWWEALCTAGDTLLDEVDAIAVAAQQHGLVTLDSRGDSVRDALLWNDLRSADAAQQLIAEFGGTTAWAKAIGVVPVAAITAAKLRWLADHEPEHADRVARVLLPHDYLTWRLRGDRTAEPTTDRSDASGTGYYSPTDNRYRTDILASATRGRIPGLPRVLNPDEPAGSTPTGTLLAAGCADNAAAALGLRIGNGDVVVSLGTSGTVFTTSPRPTADPSGAVACFADASGGFLPLVCTLNAARVLDATAQLLGVDAAGFDDLAAGGPAGADGLVLLPYLAGERTPNLPDATGSLHGLRRDTMTPVHLARAAVEGMLCNMADALDNLRSQGLPVRRVLLIGGAARSNVVGRIAAEVFNVAITIPEPAEYVALGAARQAAWALSGAATPPNWPTFPTTEIPAPDDPAPGRLIRNAYRTARLQTHGETAH